MKLIILFILLITANLSFAQGTYTDENTGLTIDYPDGWRYEIDDTFTGLLSDDGMINIITEIETDPMSPEEFIRIGKTNTELITLMLSREYGEDYTLTDYGLTTFGGIDSYYYTADIKDDFGTDQTYFVKAKFINTNYKSYEVRVTILTVESKFDQFLTKAEEILSTAYFPE